MFGILVSALYTVLGFVVRSLLVKFVLFFAVWFVAVEFLPVLVSHLPGSSVLLGAWASMPPGVAYLLNLFQVPTGLSMALAALVTRFSIRRIPLIG